MRSLKLKFKGGPRNDGSARYQKRSTRDKQEGKKSKGKIVQKNQTLGTFYQSLWIMEEGEKVMGSQEREHKKEEEEGE